MTTIRDREEKATAEVDAAVLAVHASKFEFLKAGLTSDWAKATQIRASIPLLSDEFHIWTQEWISNQEAKGKEAVQWYKKKCLQMHCCPNVAAFKTILIDMEKYIEQKHMLARQDIWVIMLFDLNAPYARAKARVKNIASQALSPCLQKHSRNPSDTVPDTDTDPIPMPTPMPMPIPINSS